jgi:hypothetical protein
LFAGGGSISAGTEGSATSILLSTPSNCVVDSNARVYFSTFDDHFIRLVTLSTKILTNYAGSGVSYIGSARPGDGGPAPSATMIPKSIFLDSSGNLYSTEGSGYLVRKIDPVSKIITRFAGTGVNSLTGLGGPATSATIPGANQYVVGDNLGNIFVGSDPRIFLVDGSGKTITQYAG